MAFNPVAAWLHMKEQLPPLPIEGVGIKYVYPVFLVLIVLEYLQARHLFDIKESLSGFVIGLGATVIRVITNVFEITLYMFLFAWAQPLREHYLGYGSLGFAWYIWIICAVADDHNFY